MKLTSLWLSAVLLCSLVVGCADQAEPAIVTPDLQVFTTIYTGAARQVAAPPFSIDLATCATARYAVPGDQGDQFALTHLSDDGHCQVWLGYDEVSPAPILHTDIYCELEPTSNADVVLASPESSGGGGCGGPPGAPVLSIASARCVPITQ